MKTFFLLGGFAGFLICAGAGLLAGHAPDQILCDAAIGCLGGALLFRWFASVLLRACAQSLADRRAAARREAEARSDAVAAPKPAPAPKAANPAVPGRPPAANVHPAARTLLPTPTPAAR
jgi:hypothetical protein